MAGRRRVTKSPHRATTSMILRAMPIAMSFLPSGALAAGWKSKHLDTGANTA